VYRSFSLEWLYGVLTGIRGLNILYKYRGIISNPKQDETKYQKATVGLFRK
jgi:hypothetical protein